MARFNRFGAVYADVVSMYPGTVLADYDGGGSSGQTVIEGVLDRIAREVASALTPEVYKQITEVDCEQIVRYATEGQTTATLGLTPTLAGNVHLWVYPSLAAMELTDREDGIALDDIWYKKPVLGSNELSGYAVTAATGAITGLPALSVGDRVYASYYVDVDSSSFSMPSVKDIVLLGAASELGARLYSDAMQEWKLVSDYKDRYRGSFVAAANEQGQLGRAFAGTFVPDELRKLTYWTEVERVSDTEFGSARLYRS